MTGIDLDLEPLLRIDAPGLGDEVELQPNHNDQSRTAQEPGLETRQARIKTNNALHPATKRSISAWTNAALAALTKLTSHPPTTGRPS